MKPPTPLTNRFMFWISLVNISLSITKFLFSSNATASSKNYAAFLLIIGVGGLIASVSMYLQDQAKFEQETGKPDRDLFEREREIERREKRMKLEARERRLREQESQD